MLQGARKVALARHGEHHATDPEDLAEQDAQHRGHGSEANGLIVGHYERAGEIKVADTALDSPSDREVARRDRMKREG